MMGMIMMTSLLSLSPPMSVIMIVIASSSRSSSVDVTSLSHPVQCHDAFLTPPTTPAEAT